ncbi:MAG: hypothetical protein JNL54_07115 [Kineosporiaceae bacterium]|nr:hypothetical protein [Kineosporiaceae bacterium]
MRAEALVAMAIIPLRDSTMITDTAVALTMTAFALLLLVGTGVAFRTVSEILYRRHRPLVFVLASQDDAPPSRRIGDFPLIQAVLVLVGIAAAAAVIGVFHPH